MGFLYFLCVHLLQNKPVITYLEAIHELNNKWKVLNKNNLVLLKALLLQKTALNIFQNLILLRTFTKKQYSLKINIFLNMLHLKTN